VADRDFVETLICLGVALAVGLLLGAERQRGEGESFGGVRTFPLYAIAGAVGALLGLWVLVAFSLCLGAFLTVAYLRESGQHPDDIGMSTEVTGLVAFGLGALCTTDQLAFSFKDRVLLVAALATGTLTLLAVKKPLHGIVARISTQDVYATARLLLLAVIVLPLLPDADLGPWGSINPRAIALLVVLVLGISFAGYVSVRALGARRGLLLTGLLGGLASSTAVTLELSRRARAEDAGVASIAAAVSMACAVMFFRVVLEVYFASPTLAATIAWPFFVTGGVAMAGAWLAYRRAILEVGTNATGVTVTNPLTLWGAAKFGGLLAAALLLAGAASHYYPSAGLYAAATVTGMADASAIALSVGRMFELGQVDAGPAVYAVAVGAASNTAAKIGLAAVIGSPRLAGGVAVVLVPAMVVGFVVMMALV